MTPSELHTADAIGLAGAVRMGQLAERLGITKGAVTQLIDRLEKKELVSRTSHPSDSRAVLISLTKKGELAFQAHEAVHQQFFQKLSKELDNKEIAIFEKGLKIWFSNKSRD
ncbi:MarR family winged helix-turn-helix transcriptional regulator [Pseudogracilibacillus sp. SO30301A]|uniref:MarR family winged helix-turn-helix transcriptional regulator n=1 Tax=Pseudogracilibacillus sp. SO30301A TaxID=3098291 RepID=UPI00300E012E